MITIASHQERTLEEQFGDHLDQNIQTIETIMGKSEDLVIRRFFLAGGTERPGAICFIDGLVNSQMVHAAIMEPMMLNKREIHTVDELQNKVLQSISGKKANNIGDALDGVMRGHTILLLDGAQEALILSTIGGDKRGIEEPTTETVIRGPRDGFTESIRTNTALVRKRIHDPKFRLDAMRIGEKTKTAINIAYIEGTVKEGLVDEIKRRLSKIKVDSVLESGYIEELMDDAPFSPFVTTQATERPDKVAASLLEGRAAIFVDNTPFPIIVPGTFWQFIQASDDYYSRYYVGSFFRMIRIAAFLINLTLPSIYVLVSSFHQEMMPTALALTIASGREVIPFPVLVEVLIMELAFELMREAGLRMPRPIGSAVSIVGSLVIGQAAVQAGIVGPFAVIIVAVTGIASFALPNYAIAFSLRLMRFPLLIASGTLGLLGFGSVIMAVILHVLSLRSFGEPYLAPLSPFRPSDQKDIIIRVPWWSMKKRPTLAQGEGARESQDSMPSPNSEDQS